MSTVVATRLIDAPVERVWNVFTDLSGRAEWLSAIDSVELVGGPAFGAGTVWRETRPMPGGTPVTEEFRVERSDPPHGFTVTSPGVDAAYRMRYVFAGRRGGTAVTVTQEGGPTVPTGRLLSIVLGGLAARASEGALRQDLDDLAAAAAG
jgi:uncharacterized protein YndB with AHSA1/START domain